MSARVAHVQTWSQAGGERPNQDRVFRLPNGLILLDGASSFGTQQRYDGAWYADHLGHELHDVLARQPGRELVDALAAAIARVPRPRTGIDQDPPSSTVAIARWNDEDLDVLVLGDSPAVVFHRDGTATIVQDDRLAAIAPQQRHAYRERLRHGGEFDAAHTALLHSLQAAQRQQRNTPGGYWIAELDPQAARHALTHTFSRADAPAVLLVSDGIAAGVEQYATPPTWHAARQVIEAEGARRLAELIHVIELSDPDGRRWPRAKRHDDKSVAFAAIG